MSWQAVIYSMRVQGWNNRGGIPDIIASALYQGLTFFVSPLEEQVRSCLHSLDSKVLHGLDQDPSLTVFCPVSAAEGKAAAPLFRPIFFCRKNIWAQF